MSKRKVEFLFFSLILLFVGCRASAPNVTQGQVELNFHMGSGGRTIIYNLTDDMVDKLKIDFKTGSTSVESKLFAYNEQIKFNLPFGAWILEFSGLDQNGNAIVFSETSFEIFSNETIMLYIELQPLMNDSTELNASGNVSVVLDWSSCPDMIKNEVTDVQAVLNELDISQYLNVDFSASSASYIMNPCPSGNYIIQFSLFNPEELLISSASEALNIRDNLASSGTILLTKEDFNLAGLSIIISIDLPEEESIVFNYTNDCSFTTSEIAVGISIEITNEEIYDGYSWSLYGYSLTSESYSLYLPVDLEVGVHNLTVYIEKGGDLYSGTLRFIVED